jgi:ParB/RepB/Spo0J family partition protein
MPRAKKVETSPASEFEEEKLKELANSIREFGLLQPITVRPIEGTDTFQIIAGERRFRAVQLLGLAQIPCLIRSVSDAEASALMLAENVARADLDPIDEGHAYHKRIERFGWSKKEVAEAAGVSVNRVTSRLKLLAVEPDIQHLCRHEQMPLLYAEMIAEKALPPLFQRKAMQALVHNPKPTWAWWRDVLADLDNLAHQQEMFADEDLLQVQTFELAAVHSEPDPPHPTTDTPPVTGETTEAMLTAHAAFWEGAASSWHTLGKPNKRNECQAAAEALKRLLPLLPASVPVRTSRKRAA